jgi:hypothetical protein
MLLTGFADLVYKRGAAAGAPAHQFLMVQTWVFFPTVAAYALLSGRCAGRRVAVGHVRRRVHAPRRLSLRA